MLKINKVNIRYWVYFLTRDKTCNKALLWGLSTIPITLIGLWTRPFFIFSLTGTLPPRLEVTLKIQLTIMLFVLYLLAFCILLIIYTKKYKNTENLTKEEFENYYKYFNIPRRTLGPDGWELHEPRNK